MLWRRLLKVLQVVVFLLAVVEECHQQRNQYLGKVGICLGQLKGDQKHQVIPHKEKELPKSKKRQRIEKLEPF